MEFLKNAFWAIGFACAAMAVTTQADAQQLPAVALKDLDGKSINTSDFARPGQPTLICFWAILCSPCKR